MAIDLTKGGTGNKPRARHAINVDLPGGKTVVMRSILSLRAARQQIAADALRTIETKGKELESLGADAGLEALTAAAQVRQAAEDLIAATVTNPEDAETLLDSEALQGIEELVAFIGEWATETAAGEAQPSSA